jgi:hypothetical protein
MLQALTRTLALLLAALALAVGALAQDPDQEPKDEPIRQIKLTEAQVKSFISAQPDIVAVFPKVSDAGENIDPALQTELDGIARKHGFKDYEELEDVASNIAIVLAGFDAKGEFTEPLEALKKELADVTADKLISEKDKKKLIAALNVAISTTPRLEHLENVELVKAHKVEIEKALQ